MKIAALLLSASLAVATNAVLAAYPDRPVKVVVPFPAGSATDLVTRLVSRELQDALGQPFVVENKPGAQGAIASELVAKSKPDGYTLMLPANTHAANVGLFKKLPYDPVKDFVPIARIASTSLVLMVKTEFPAKTVPEFIAHVKKSGGKLSAGYGSSSSQVSISQLKRLAKVEVADIPYKGIPLAVNDLLAGAVDFTFVDLGNALAQAKGNKLRGLAITDVKRSALAPDWPPMADTLPGFEITAWFALLAPAGTPADIVQLLQDATIKALGNAVVQEKLALIGMQAAPLKSQETAEFIKAEVIRWSRLIKEAGIQPE